MPFPFEIGFDEVRSDLDGCVDAVFGCLESEFLVMPKGDGFVEFPDFENGYEALKRATGASGKSLRTRSPLSCSRCRLH